ncbi:MAG TPA: hypothetical protein VG938_20095 [Verrucomicrobiae bacterium]|jgi:hypothetical protein|nr:hypothetical protein [Verrucomicrobiae bacterium]
MSKHCVAFSETPVKASLAKTQRQPTPVSLFHAMTVRTSPAAAIPAQTAGGRLDFFNDI